MKAEELRIGNYVEYRKDIVGIGIIKALTSYEPQKLIYQCSIDFIDSEEGLGSDLQFINPIPLTEEWLIKFGFKCLGKKRNWFDNENYSINLEGSFAVYHGNSWLTILQRSVKHVHQLQNLYHALTGKELEIKLAH